MVRWLELLCFRPKELRAETSVASSSPSNVSPNQDALLQLFPAGAPRTAVATGDLLVPILAGAAADIPFRNSQTPTAVLALAVERPDHMQPWGTTLYADAAAGSGSLRGKRISSETGADVDALLSRRQLRPLFVNDAAKAFLRVDSLKAYQLLLQQQMTRDPSLATLLASLMRASQKGQLDGSGGGVCHHLPGMPEIGAAPLTLQISASTHKLHDGEPPVPCLVVEYSPGCTWQQLNQRLQRDEMLLANIPAIVTLFDLDQHVVQQNQASLDYMRGVHIGPDTPESPSRNDERWHGMNSLLGGIRETSLQQLMRLEGHKLQELLRVVMAGGVWVGIVVVPSCRPTTDDSGNPPQEARPKSMDTRSARDLAMSCASYTRRKASLDERDLMATRRHHHVPPVPLPSLRVALLQDQHADLTAIAAGNMSSIRECESTASSRSQSPHYSSQRLMEPSHTQSALLTRTSPLDLSRSATSPPLRLQRNSAGVVPHHLHLARTSAASAGTAAGTAAGGNSGGDSGRLLQMSAAPRAGYDRSVSGGSASLARAASDQLGGNGGGCSSGGPLLVQAPVGKTELHEVRARLVHDPLAGCDLILVIQNDVTCKLEAEARTAGLLLAEQRILGSIFPRHVIEALTDENLEAHGLSYGYDRTSTGAISPQNSWISPRASSEYRMPGGGAGGSSRVGSSPVPDYPSGRSSLEMGGNSGLRAFPTSTMGNGHLSTMHDQVTIMFADIVGFTTMCHCLPPGVVMAFLNELYSAIDDLVLIYKVYKVETAGDCYIVAGGLMHRDEDGYTSVRNDVDPLNALTVLEFSKAVLRVSRQVMNPVTHEPIQMRIGIHSGPVVSGVVGNKMPRFCLFGDTMNTAQRMEATARPGCIHVSEATHRLLPNERWDSTATVQVKSKGPMKTALWVPSYYSFANDAGAKPSRSRRSFCAYGQLQKAFMAHSNSANL